MSLDEPQISEDHTAFISTACLVESLHAAGYIPSASNSRQAPLSSERAASRRNFPPPIMKILDAFADLLDINNSRVAVACRHPSLRCGVLHFELVVCGEFPGRSARPPHDNMFVRPLQLLVANGSFVSSREHLEVINHFLGQLCQAGDFRKQAHLALKLYIAASFARPVFDRLRTTDVRQFLTPLRRAPRPSSLNKTFAVDDPDPIQKEYDHRLLARLEHPRLVGLLGSMDLHQLRNAGKANGQLYTNDTCDNVHDLLLFLLGAYQRQICKAIQATLIGQKAMSENRWDQKMSKKFSRTCSTLAGYGVLLYELSGSSILAQHLERISDHLSLPYVDLGSTPHPHRRIVELCGAIRQGDPVKVYLAWIMMQVGHLEHLSFISGALRPIDDRVQNASHPPPRISITSLVSLPEDQQAPSLVDQLDWQTVVKGSLAPDPGEEGHVSAEDAISLLKEVIDAGVLEGELISYQDPRMHPDLCLGTLLLQSSSCLGDSSDFFCQRDREEAGTDLLYEPIRWNREKTRYYPMGTSGGPCLNCSVAFEAIKDERKPYIQTSWASHTESHHLIAQPCHLPRWMPASLVKSSLKKLRIHLQAALDECQDRWGETDISVESQNSEIEEPARSSPVERLPKRKRTESQSDPATESRRARPSLPT